MKELKLNKGSISALIHFDETTNTYTLEAGSTVNLLQASIVGKNRENRINNTKLENGTISTTTAVHFKSLSGLASFLTGSQTNGNRYFANTILANTTSTATTTTAPVSTSTAAPTVEDTKPKENKPTTSTATEETAQQPAKQEEQKVIVKLTKEEIKKRNNLADQLNNFGGDWGFYIDDRIKDSLKYQPTKELRQQFLIYASELSGLDESLIQVCKDKLNSAEFEQISNDLDSIKSVNTRINKRLVIYYGEAGSGKTYQAIQKYGGKNFAVASATEKPSELFTTFNPTTNSYEKTLLSQCMENGETYIYDEGNLASRYIWERLQGVLDNTTEIVDRGIRIHIKEGFKLVTTMNLKTNLGKFPLPTPIISRAEEIKKFEPIKSNLADHIW